MKKISVQPPERCAPSPYIGAVSPAFPENSLLGLISSLRLGEQLCQGGREDRGSLFELARVGFSSSPTTAVGVTKEILLKINAVQKDILVNPASNRILPSIREILTDLEPISDFVGQVGSPVSPSPFISIAAFPPNKNS